MPQPIPALTSALRRPVGLILLMLVPSSARAHADQPPAPHDALTAWSLEPAVITLLVLFAWLYARGLRELWQHAGYARGVAPWRVFCHWGGIVALILALVSPIDAIGESLFSMHMVQHLLLTMVAAPLLVLGGASTTIVWALPMRARRRLVTVSRSRAFRRTWASLTHPLAAWALHVIALVAWHVPSPYELAVRQDAVHTLEHASFFLTALLFWWVLAAPRARQRLGFGPAMLYLFTAAIVGTLLGALITTATTPWYSVHAATAPLWGLTALEDQQLAGLIMWVPAGVIYLVAIIPLCVRALSDSEPRTAAA